MEMASRNLTAVDFDKAVKDAPLAMIDFWADWCGPCMMLAPMVEHFGEVYGRRALVAKVNIDEQPELARRFGVTNIPTVMFLKNGKEFNRQVGMMLPPVYEKILEENLK